MNNFERQEEIDELESGYSKRELAVMVLDLTKREREIKAEGVREAIAHSVMNDNHQRSSYWAYDVMAKYANKLEQKK